MLDISAGLALYLNEEALCGKVGLKELESVEKL